MSWLSGFEPIVQADAPLAPLTWYRLGGPARWLVSPRDVVELAAVLRRMRDAGVAWRILGRGANILIPDEGYDGAVIRLVGPAFEGIFVEEDEVDVGAGADLPRLIQKALGAGLVGLEALAGIPATVGGALRMNAGGRHGEIAQFVETVGTLSAAGEFRTLRRAEIGFSYRHAELDGLVIVGATLCVPAGDPLAARERYREIWLDKGRTQPHLNARTSGCIFKNPPGDHAGRLLDAARLKGTRVGGAEISPVHANFIIARDGARTADVLSLIHLARERVCDETGVMLETEVDIWN